MCRTFIVRVLYKYSISSQEPENKKLTGIPGVKYSHDKILQSLKVKVRLAGKVPTSEFMRHHNS